MIEAVFIIPQANVRERKRKPANNNNILCKQYLNQKRLFILIITN